MTAGFLRGVNDICAVLGFYAAQNASFLPTFRDNPSALEDGIRNFGKKLAFCAA
jgi:hypothetical protein